MEPSCQSCLHRARAVDATTQFKQAGMLGPVAEVCRAKGIIISLARKSSNDDETNDAIQRAAAAECNFHPDRIPHGIIPPVAKEIDFNVGSGDVDIIMEATKANSVGEPERPHSCSGCKFFVRPETVVPELGWQMGMCRFKGSLVPYTALMSSAATCGVGIVGEPSVTVGNVKLKPIYEAIVGGPAVAAPTVVVSAEPAPDPRDYVSDRDVSDADKARHIRAWRRIPSPDRKFPDQWLPVFDGRALTGSDPRDTYGNHTPWLYVDHMGLTYDLTFEMVKRRRTPVLIGTAGTGKTEAACYMAWLMDLPLTRIAISPKTEMYQIFGEKTVVPGPVDPTTGKPTESIIEFKWGRFPIALSKPNVLVVDEANLREDFYMAARSVFDSARQLVLDEDQGVEVKLHEWCFPMLTQNPSYDPNYVGTEQTSAADLSRCSAIFVDVPTPDVERQIIAAHCHAQGFDIDAKLLDKILQVSIDIRDLIQRGPLQTIAWGVRDNVKVAMGMEAYPPQKAYRRAIADALEPSVADALMASVTSVFD